MAHVTLGEAARQTGRSKSQISRAIRDGRLSAERSAETASFRFEQSELQRCLDATNVIRATALTSAVGDSATDLHQALEIQIAGLREVADLLRSQLTDALSQRDKWQEAFQAQSLLLPPPQPPATPVAEEPKPAAKPAERAKRQTFWQWLFESRVA
jgi:hypothetical protein